MLYRGSLIVVLALVAQLWSSVAEGAGGELVRRDLMVPMRDGVRLATDVHLPAGDGPWPAVVRRTPYGKSGAGSASQYTRRGFAFVAQDQRGLYKSEGTYVPHENEADDGYDTIEWVARQKWCDGQVGISGYSALGIAANLAASAAPPHLVAAFVAVAPESLFEEARFVGGVFKEADTSNWLSARGLSEAQIEAYRRRPTLDQRWLETDFIFRRHRVQIPIYNLGGWYDLFLKGTIDNYRYLQDWGRPGARGRQKVRVGPFGHGGLRGDLRYPDASGWYDTDEELRWFDYWLKGIDNGIADEPPVQWYQRAAARRGQASDKNEWRWASRWPPEEARIARLYLHAGGRLGALPPSERQSLSEYRFDPGHPVPTVGGLNLTLPIGPMDQRVIGERKDYLRFETSPLTADVELAGPLSMELWASTDGTDTDFVVKLVDVYPDGYEALVIDSVLRARYRRGRRAEDVLEMTADRPERLLIDLWHTGITFERGHRIAVHVTSSNWPRFAVNPNTGASPATRHEAQRIATNRVFHEADRASVLLVPLLAGDLPEGPGGELNPER